MQSNEILPFVDEDENHIKYDYYLYCIKMMLETHTLHSYVPGVLQIYINVIIFISIVLMVGYIARENA